LLLINPSARPSKRKGKAKMRKHRTAAQKRATAKLVALNRAKRRTPKRRVARRAPVAAYAANPAPRKRARRRSVSSVRARVRKYRRNPSGRSMSVMPLLKDSAMGAVGAVAVTALYSFMPVPATFATGNMAHVAKAAFAVLIGTLGRKVLPAGMASKMAAGSLTVTMYEALKDNIGASVPGMHGIGYYPGGRVMSNYPASNAAPAPAALSEYINRGMGEYINTMGEVGNEIY
jgi:hypothetical protein